MSHPTLVIEHVKRFPGKTCRELQTLIRSRVGLDPDVRSRLDYLGVWRVLRELATAGQVRQGKTRACTQDPAGSLAVTTWWPA